MRSFGVFGVHGHTYSNIGPAEVLIEGVDKSGVLREVRIGGGFCFRLPMVVACTKFALVATNASVLPAGSEHINPPRPPFGTALEAECRCFEVDCGAISRHWLRTSKYEAIDWKKGTRKAFKFYIHVESAATIYNTVANLMSILEVLYICSRF